MTKREATAILGETISQCILDDFPLGELVGYEAGNRPDGAKLAELQQALQTLGFDLAARRVDLVRYYTP